MAAFRSWVQESGCLLGASCPIGPNGECSGCSGRSVAGLCSYRLRKLASAEKGFDQITVRASQKIQHLIELAMRHTVVFSAALFRSHA